MKLSTLSGTFACVVAAAAPTFNKDIAPILHRNCAGCHRPGEVAPFSLLTYQDAAKRAALIASITQKRVMPPWKAEPGYGEFKDARRLSDGQIALISEWAKHGEPDRVLTVPTKFTVPPDGPDQFRCFAVPLDLDHDVYIGATEFRPDNR